MSGQLRPINCVSCGRQRAAGPDVCPHCGEPPLAHKQSAAEFAERLRDIAQRDRLSDKSGLSGAGAA